jgi:hypothetical protein
MDDKKLADEKKQGHHAMELMSKVLYIAYCKKL